jgi:hypothetical protein
MKKYLIVLNLTLMLILLSTKTPALAVDKWSGNDVVVGEKIKDISGTEAADPIINLTGDLGLFVFAIGGFAAGTIVGYQWRKLFGEKKED